MNGVESVGSTNYVDPVLRVMATSREQSTIREEGRSTGGQAGMGEALQLSGHFVRQSVTETGFINIQAGGAENIEAFVRLTTEQSDNVQAGIEPAVAAELAVHTGTQMAADVNMAARIMGRVDPARATALLK